jgi:hypothetical protein
MHAWTFTAAAGLLGASLVAAPLAPATAASPWSNSTIPMGPTAAPQAPATSSVQTTSGSGSGQNFSGVMTTTATAMYTAAKPYGCSIALFNPTYQTYNITLTNMWSAPVPRATTTVLACAGTACASFGVQSLGDMYPGETQTTTEWLNGASPASVANPFTTCTASAAGPPPPPGRGPH